MREDVRQALAIDASSTIEERTIDITTIGRRSGLARRIEIAFYRLGEDIYLSRVEGADDAEIAEALEEIRALPPGSTRPSDTGRHRPAYRSSISGPKG